LAYLYTITNKINHKVYVGKTTASDIFLYWKKHIRDALTHKQSSNRIFYRALRKYWPDGFRWEVVEELSSNEEICRAETSLISKLKTNVVRYGPDFGYNMTDGGEGTPGYQHTEETKNKISFVHKGKKISEEQKKNHSVQMTGSGNGMFSKNHTEESKISMSVNSSGIKNGMFGKTHSNLVRSKIRGKCLKFSKNDALNIRELRLSGMKIKDIALKYSVSRQTITKIISFKAYND
jgi:group I intron endonuclease